MSIVRYHVEEMARPYYGDPPESNNLELAEPYAVRVNSLLYIAPPALPFDGASIPRFFWRVIGPPLRGKYRRAAVIHDACYKGVVIAIPYQPEMYACYVNDLPKLTSLKGEIPQWLLDVEKRPVEREEADELLRQLSLWNGVHPVRAQTMYGAVRGFAGGAWKREHAKFEGWLPRVELVA